MAKIVAIHQPNFFPWLGYFDKLARADIFVILDHVQFPKKQGTWGNRVQFMRSGQARWVTMPIRRDYHGMRRFNEMQLADSPWRHDLLQSLRMNYGRSRGFSEVFPLVSDLVSCPSNQLVEFNQNALKAISQRLGIVWNKSILSSTLGAEGQASDLLINLIRAVGGTAYLCGGGSGGYLEPDKFAAAGIDLIYQNFQHPHYDQGGGRDFVPGLSCLDALFHCGEDAVASWLKSPPGSCNKAAA